VLNVALVAVSVVLQRAVRVVVVGTDTCSNNWLAVFMFALLAFAKRTSSRILVGAVSSAFSARDVLRTV
jgi:hypothetical protein